MAKPTFESQWGRYERLVIHPDAGPQQRNDLKRCFYAGAYSIWTMLMFESDPGQEVTEEDDKWVASMFDELREYLEGQCLDDLIREPPEGSA